MLKQDKRVKELKNAEALQGSFDLSKEFDDFEFILEQKDPLTDVTEERLSFMLGVVNIIVSALVLAGYQKYVGYWFSIKFVVLFLLRVLVYSTEPSMTYLLVEFVYFGNTLVYAYLWFFSNSEAFFLVTFALCNGPILWELADMRNSLVFHSLQRTTSLFMRFSGAATMFIIRWYAIESFPAPPTEGSFQYLCVYPWLIYLAHMMFYYIVVELPSDTGLKKNKSYMTSYRHLIKHKGLRFKFVNLFGKKFRVVMFGLYRLAYCFLTLLPMYMLYNQFVIHYIIITFFALLATWNGSKVYVSALEHAHPVKGE
eukprot:GCRY01000882.1.p1 GENE.GCRY01000882.1~~GCRY01000882.1.p1  ORF type:complete len:312 (-),score=32.92 GCRY01000882.1:160-1095(-)